MKFEEKVKSMTAREIINLMIESLRNPVIKIDMDTFGAIVKEPVFFGLFSKKICYGCAATNLMCNIAGVKLDEHNINSIDKKSKKIDSGELFMRRFEMSIDELRKGNIANYNYSARLAGMPLILEDQTVALPYLNSSYTEKDLEAYERLAEYQPN